MIITFEADIPFPYGYAVDVNITNIELGNAFLTGRNPADDILFAILKAVLQGLIIWHGMKWPEKEA